MKRFTFFFWALATCFVAMQVRFLNHSQFLWWDEAVYLNMSVFLTSLGSVGYWEILRPPLWPVVLGLLGQSLILGKLVVLLASLSSAYLLFRWLQGWAGLISGFVLLFTPVWFSYSTHLLTGVLSGTLVLWSFYAYYHKKFALSGVIVAFAVLVRFPAGIALFSLLVVSVILAFKEAKYQSFVNLLIGASVPLIVWVLVNVVVWYHDYGVLSAILPLLHGFFNAGFDNSWLRTSTPWFYLKNLLFLAPGLLLSFLCVSRLRKKDLPIAVFVLCSLIFFSMLGNQQWRFILLLAPCFSYFVGRTLQEYWNHDLIRKLIFVILTVHLCVFVIHIPQPTHDTNNEWSEIFDQELDGVLLSTDPVSVYYSGMRAFPIYYEHLPFFAEGLAYQPSTIVFSSSHVPCAPDDQRCRVRVDNILRILYNSYELQQVVELSDGLHYVFTSQAYS